jgi:hypothetical protein
VPQSFLQRQLGQRSRQLGQNRIDRRNGTVYCFPTQSFGFAGGMLGERTMNSANALFVEVERNDNSKKVGFENSFCNIVDGGKISAGKRLSVINPATGKQLAAVPDVDRAWLDKAIGVARNAFAGWSATPFGSRKEILASLLNRIDEYADELSALLAAEQGGPIVQARWEIDLLTKGFGPALMQMEPPAKEQGAQAIEHITKRYVPIDVGNVVTPWHLPVILSFGKVLPALLAGDTVVLRPSSSTPLTVLRISEYIRELLPPGVLNVVTGGHDLWPWVSSHSGIDLITFTGSPNVGKHLLDSAVGQLEPGANHSRAVVDADPEKIAFFGSIMLVPVSWKPGRFGLAGTLFEILSFRPVRMRTQVLVWRLARKASNVYPIFRNRASESAG